MMSADHENLTYVESDKQFYTYPPHVDDIEKMPDKEQIKKELSQKRDINSLKTSFKRDSINWFFLSSIISSALKNNP